MWPSFTVIISGLFFAYIAHSIWTIYGIFFPTPCPKTHSCLESYLLRKPKLEMKIFTSLKPKVISDKNLKEVWTVQDFNVEATFEKSFNISLPLKTRNNGSLYIHTFVYPQGDTLFSSSRTSYAGSRLTSYAFPKSETFNLMGDDSKSNKNSSSPKDIVTHWRPRVTVNVMEDTIAFDRYAVPAEIFKVMKVSPEGDYLPIIYIDELAFRLKDLMLVNESSKQMPLTISYSPISVGKLRMWLHMQEAMNSLMKLGFTEKDTDEVKGIFSDTNFYFLALTFTVAAFHLLFDFLAFKNDISYWKNRRTMVGLSTRVVVWRCASTCIIFLYLMDEETSLLVLIPAGIGSVIELWKVKKAFKFKIVWTGWKPSFEFGTTTDKEKETQEFDSQAMKYLSYVLYPLCIGGAVYSLLYVPHKSWYSWSINSLVNGVYAFGFIFMLPQLFVNYKLKSVAHLPWRAFMYKAFNTFIDDIFAFIITMPTAHRVACFRDDVVFLIYLYQRWLYPVDKTRVNEYGQSFDEQQDGDKKTK